MMMLQHAGYQHQIACSVTRSWHSGQTPFARPPAKVRSSSSCGFPLFRLSHAFRVELRGDIIKSESGQNYAEALASGA